MPPPDEEARRAILRVHTRKQPWWPGTGGGVCGGGDQEQERTDQKVDWGEVARRTEGYTGADLQALAREAALVALERDVATKWIGREDLEEALRRVPASPPVSVTAAAVFAKFARGRGSRAPGETVAAGEPGNVWSVPGSGGFTMGVA